MLYLVFKNYLEQTGALCLGRSPLCFDKLWVQIFSFFLWIKFEHNVLIFYRVWTKFEFFKRVWISMNFKFRRMNNVWIKYEYSIFNGLGPEQTMNKVWIFGNEFEQCMNNVWIWTLFEHTMNRVWTEFEQSLNFVFKHCSSPHSPGAPIFLLHCFW